MRMGAQEEPLRLRDGGTVAVRTVAPADAPAVAALFGGLSPGSIAMRFGAARRPPDPAECGDWCRPPGPGGLGLVALAADPAERAIALARYDRAAGAVEAEVSLAVADAWQGRGIGTGLLERLLARAGGDGLDALWALARPENRAVARVLRDLGGPVEERRTRDGLLFRVATRPDESREEAAIARAAASAAASLRPLMRPRAIAVAGASRDPAAPGGAVARALAESGFPGPLRLVNRAGGRVDGRLLHPALADLPEPPDLVVVAVPAAAVPGVAREAAAAGARALVVISSGFAESGPDGAALEAELLHTARTTGLRVVGPNCLGVASTDPERPFNATFGAAVPAPGRVGLASQSGGVGIAALAALRARGVGVSSFVSLGNRADVSSNDLLAWWAQDERTRAAALYLEGFGNPRRFARMARRVAGRMPILALKAGRGPAGRRGAGSHTAALAAGEPATEALFRLAGVVRVETMEELVDASRLLAAQAPPAGDRVAIIGNAGGPAILAADACEAAGLTLPAFDDALRARLERAAPGIAGAANPVDLGAGAAPEALAAAADAVIGAGAADALLLVHAETRGRAHGPVAEVAEALARRTTVAGCDLGAGGAPEGARVPWTDLPERAARALAHAARAGAAARRPPDPPEPSPGADAAAARAVLAAAEPGAWLGAEAVRAVLAAYGIAVPRAVAVRDAAGAADAQRRLGAVVAVKLISDAISHKTDVGGVVLGCGTPEEAAAAVTAIRRRLAERGLGDAMTGALVQEQAGPGLDLIAGATADPVFGPVVLAGLGGVEAELWADRAVALAPVGPRTARDLWRGLRGSRLIDGWRGAAGADRDALADLITRISWLASDQPLLAELDCNPVRWSGEQRRLLALDARIRRAGGPADAPDP
jgi:acyl-CoA synthetase (NDP forming)/GNAT superfamily N-acetyltransferase